jgi:hypothetical protein
MPSNSKNPQAANLGALLKGLKEAGVDFIIASKLSSGGHKISVLSLEAMVHMKNSADTPEDEYRLQILRETLKQIKGE